MNNNHGVTRQVHFHANKNEMRVVVISGNLNSVDEMFKYNGSNVKVDIENAIGPYLERGYTFTSHLTPGINRANERRARRIKSKLERRSIKEVVK